MAKKNSTTTKPNITKVSNNVPAEMDWEHFSPLEVKVGNNFDKSFKLFRTIVQADGILALFKEKQSYEKPSVKKRRKSNEAIRRAFEQEMKMQKIKSGEYDREKAKKLANKEKKMKARAAEEQKSGGASTEDIKNV